MRTVIIATIISCAAMAAKADYWMTFCKMPGGRQYSQVGYAKQVVALESACRRSIHLFVVPTEKNRRNGDGKDIL